MRHDLPSGAWVELRDPMSITHGQWTDAVAGLPDAATNDELAMLLAVDAWSYESPPPSIEEPKALRDIPQIDAKALGRLLVPMLRMLHPLFDPSPDPDSPTEPSSD